MTRLACDALEERGLQVIRFDHRDAGRSTHFATGADAGGATTRHVGERAFRRRAPGYGPPMKTKTLLTMGLPIVGGINWGLVAAGRFDLVAKLTGNRFGETNAASRVVYGAVGVASVLAAAELARTASSS
jgi:uncharacterized membrane protein YuzA (DUF378 family)